MMKDIVYRLMAFEVIDAVNFIFLYVIFFFAPSFSLSLSFLFPSPFHLSRARSVALSSRAMSVRSQIGINFLYTVLS